jgi:membrane-bound lytic murein transglycosylase D
MSGLKKYLYVKDLSNFLSLACLIILVGYISYSEVKKNRAENTFSDDGVVLDELERSEYGEPLSAIAFDLPEKATFATEALPLSVPDVRERLDKELQINSYLHSNTIFLMKRANRWLPQMEAILKQHNIPEDFKYLPLIESNLLNVSSPRHAVGYWQILEDSGKEFGLTINKEVDERYDPLKSTVAACKYLSKAYKKFGNWTLVAASYNMGRGGVDRALESQNVKSYYDLYLNDETSRYVFRIVAIKEIIEHPVKYGFKINPKNLYEEEPLRYVDVNQSISDLITFANEQGINYKLLKRYNPWLRGDKLSVKKGATFKIAFPTTTTRH